MDIASGRSRSRSRSVYSSRGRDDSGNVDARERTREVDAAEPDAALRREKAEPGLRKGDRKIEDLDE